MGFYKSCHTKLNRVWNQNLRVLHKVIGKNYQLRQFSFVNNWTYVNVCIIYCHTFSTLSSGNFRKNNKLRTWFYVFLFSLISIYYFNLSLMWLCVCTRQPRLVLRHHSANSVHKRKKMSKNYKIADRFYILIIVLRYNGLKVRQ